MLHSKTVLAYFLIFRVLTNFALLHNFFVLNNLCIDSKLVRLFWSFQAARRVKLISNLWELLRILILIKLAYF